MLAESMAASRDYIGLRKIILEKKALLDKIKEILPNTAINTKYLELDLKLTDQITTELGKRCKEQVQFLVKGIFSNLPFLYESKLKGITE